MRICIISFVKDMYYSLLLFLY